jgi:hypothetical protein
LREELRLRVLENRMLRKMFRRKRDAVTGDWGRLLNNLYSSPNIVQLIKSRRIGWAGHVVRRAERRCAYRFLVGLPEQKRPLGGPSHRSGIILKWILKK